MPRPADSSDDEDTEDTTTDSADDASLDGDDEPLILGDKASNSLFDLGEDEELAAFDDEDFDDDFDDDFEEEDDELADDDAVAESNANLQSFGDDDDEDVVLPDDED
jgi:hypothetical protein